MTRFRLFGRPVPDRAPAEDEWPTGSTPYDMPYGPAPGGPLPYGPPSDSQPPFGPSPFGHPPGWGAPPGATGASRWTSADGAGPATRAARPANGHGWAPVDDPLTDPHGFPPVPGSRAAGTAQGWTSAPPGPPPAPHPTEAAALAGAFAVDYLSWDEDDPDRRGRVLCDYLSAPGSDPARLGWSGHGRQRAELALPGLVRPDGEGRVLVDVRVRVTPYRSVGDHDPETTTAEPEPDIAGVPAVAPAPTGRGWRSLASYWVRISVPVAVDAGRLVVDAWEETLGEEHRPSPPAAATGPDDHTLADDDPLLPPRPAADRPGGAW